MLCSSEDDGTITSSWENLKCLMNGVSFELGLSNRFFRTYFSAGKYKSKENRGAFPFCRPVHFVVWLFLLVTLAALGVLIIGFLRPFTHKGWSSIEKIVLILKKIRGWAQFACHSANLEMSEETSGGLIC